MNPSLLFKPSWLSRLGLGLASVLAVVASLAIASVLFAVLLVAGLVAGGWLWWQFRRLARQARNAAPDFIEGEYRLEPEHSALEDRRTVPAKPAEDQVSPTPRRAP